MNDAVSDYRRVARLRRLVVSDHGALYLEVRNSPENLKTVAGFITARDKKGRYREHIFVKDISARFFEWYARNRGDITPALFEFREILKNEPDAHIKGQIVNAVKFAVCWELLEMQKEPKQTMIRLLESKNP